MKLQKLKINNRYSYEINFESQRQSKENFIIPLDAQRTNIPLLKFMPSSKDGILVESDQGPMECFLKDASVSLRQDAEILRKVDVVLNFSISDTVDKFNVANDTNSGLYVHWSTNDDYSLLMDIGVNVFSAFQLNVQINLSYEDQHFGLQQPSRFILINAVPIDMIADAVLDYGSEASQSLVASRNSSRAVTINNISNLFEDIKEYAVDEVRNPQTPCDSDYFQYDDSSNNLFRSRFFIHDNISRTTIDDTLRNGMKHTPDLLRILTTEEEMQSGEFKADYIPAPNMKLSSYGGVTMKKIKVDGKSIPITGVGGNCYFYYRLSVLVFLRQILNRVSANPDFHFVSIHLLMPNVYLQHEINEILNLLQDDLTKLIESDYQTSIFGFELTAVSESDASIMGVCEQLMANGDFKGDGNYLLLDAGKGTLDFSLVRIEQGSIGLRFQNIWRSGIVGAGSSLSYGYFLALIHEYLTKRCSEYSENSNNLIKSFIFRNILGEGPGQDIAGSGDTASIMMMMKAIDKYKTYQSSSTQQRKNVNQVDPVPLCELYLDGFVSWLESGINDTDRTVVSIDDPNKFISRMIDALVHETIRKIKMMQVGNINENEIKYVIFAGRAFNLQRFRQHMFESIRATYDNVHPIEFIQDDNAISLKTVCLLCLNSLVRGNYSRKIESRPLLIQRYNERAFHKSDDDEHTDKHSFLDSLRNLLRLGRNNKQNNIQNESTTANSDEQANVENFETRQRSFLDNVLNNREDNLEVSTDEDMHFNIIDSSTAAFNLSGEMCALNGYANGEADLFFVDGQYYVRFDNTFDSLRRPSNFTISSFVQSSFFPNFTPRNEGDIILIPKVGNDEVEREQNNEVNQHQERTVVHENRTPSAQTNKPRSSIDQITDELDKVHNV